MAHIFLQCITRSVQSQKVHCFGQLVTAGHSMGGAQAELFSACANRGPPSGEQADAACLRKLKEDIRKHWKVLST